MSKAPQLDHLPDWIRNHAERYLETDGAEGHMWDSTVVGGPGPLPTLLLTTTGRKSGEPRLLPLIYGERPDGYAIIASKGGAPAHPAWYLNLVDQPEVEVQVKDRRFKARARTAETPEREEIWQQMRDIYPPYDEYQAKAGRQIPVVVLEPLED